MVLIPVQPTLAASAPAGALQNNHAFVHPIGGKIGAARLACGKIYADAPAKNWLGLKLGASDHVDVRCDRSFKVEAEHDIGSGYTLVRIDGGWIAMVGGTDWAWGDFPAPAVQPTPKAAPTSQPAATAKAGDGRGCLSQYAPGGSWPEYTVHSDGKNWCVAGKWVPRTTGAPTGQPGQKPVAPVQLERTPVPVKCIDATTGLEVALNQCDYGYRIKWYRETQGTVGLVPIAAGMAVLDGPIPIGDVLGLAVLAAGTYLLVSGASWYAQQAVTVVQANQVHLYAANAVAAPQPQPTAQVPPPPPVPPVDPCKGARAIFILLRTLAKSFSGEGRVNTDGWLVYSENLVDYHNVGNETLKQLVKTLKDCGYPYEEVEDHGIRYIKIGPK